MESAVTSFALTVERQLHDVEATLARIESHPEELEEIDITELDVEDPAYESLLVGKKVKVLLRDVDVIRWRQDLTEDRDRLAALLDAARQVSAARDAKLEALRTMIAEKVRNPLNPGNRKVIVFTAFADTARYLYEELSGWARTELGVESALVTGAGRNQTTIANQRKDLGSILTAFSPRSKERPAELAGEGELDLLIATDCISEGQNLQDCDWLINYDIHWNPVRIIQRFGRIDRIGSLNDAVQLVNFWPVADLDLYLNVKQRVEARMALADLAATQTDNLLEVDQLEDLISEDLRFRNKQLKKLQHEVLDLEDLDDSPSLTSFSLDEFRLELLQFLETRRAELEEAPLGLYAVVPPPEKHAPPIQPGALFCLRRASQVDQKSSTGEKLNPLAPHFLVYLHDDGTVRFSFAQPKEALNLLRALAAGKSSAFAKLCAQFDSVTANGADMSHYADLIASALRAIETTFQKRAAVNLLSGRDGLLPTLAESVTADQGDWELVTWLAIVKPS